MPPFEQADSAFASGSPFLPFLEPALLLMLPTRLAFGGPIRNGNTFHPHFQGSGLVLRRIESGIGGNQMGSPSREFLMGCDGGDQQIAVARLLIVDFKVDH